MISLLLKRYFSSRVSMAIRRNLATTETTHKKPSSSSHLIYPEAEKEIASKNYELIKATSKDYNKIMCLLWQAYFPDEPIMRGLGLGNTFNPLIEDLVMNVLQEDLSIMAIDKKSGNLAGCAVNGISNKDSAYRLYELSKKISDKKTSHLYELYSFIMTIPQIHKKFETEQIFEVAFLGVHPASRKQGLGTALLKESINSAYQKKHYVVRVDASSVHMASICEKLSLLKISDIPYDLYVDEKKTPVMNINEPDLTCQVYIHTSK